MSHEPHGSQAHGRIPYWVCLGPFWAMLGHFGLCWARVGTILGLSWAILGYVGTFWAMLEPYWAHLGPFWALFGSVSAFVLDSGISASLTFRPCKRVQKTPKKPEKIHQKYQEKIQFVDYLAGGFCCYFLVVFVSFLGHAAVRLCLPDLGLMLGIVGYVGTFWATLSHFWGILWFLYVSVGFCWARIGTILGSSWAIWAHLGPFGLILGHFGPFSDLCRPLFWTRACQRR